MKTIRLFLIAAALISTTAVSTLSAQQVAKGDSVMIKRETTHYLTGQRPSSWVWDRVFRVGQVGTKRHPDGVLLMPILSWVSVDDIVNVNGRAAQAKEQAQAEQAAEKDAFESAGGTPEEKAAAAAKAAEEEKARQDSIEAVRQARRDSIAAAEKAAIERAKAYQDSIIAAEKARQDSILAAELAAIEQARQDSIAAAEKERKRGHGRFTIGARGGASALLHKVEQGKWTCGGDGILDLQYAHYWSKEGRPVDLGLLLGVGIGYSQSGMKAAVNTQTTYVDNTVPSFPLTIDYTVRADEVKETDGQLQLEIPLMFSLISEKGFFFNIGPKIMLPLYTPYTQKISNNENTYISAYFREIGVPVTNEVVTGVLAEDQYITKNTDNGNQFTINILLGGELGWEWKLKSGNSFGLGVYGNYGVFNSFKGNPENIPLIQVTPPAGDEIATVEVHSATKTYANKLGFFDAGLKVAYHFNFKKKK